MLTFSRGNSIIFHIRRPKWPRQWKSNSNCNRKNETKRSEKKTQKVPSNAKMALYKSNWQTIVLAFEIQNAFQKKRKEKRKRDTRTGIATINGKQSKNGQKRSKTKKMTQKRSLIMRSCLIFLNVLVALWFSKVSVVFLMWKTLLNELIEYYVLITYHAQKSSFFSASSFQIGCFVKFRRTQFTVNVSNSIQKLHNQRIEISFCFLTLTRPGDLFTFHSHWNVTFRRKRLHWIKFRWLAANMWIFLFQNSFTSRTAKHFFSHKKTESDLNVHLLHFQMSLLTNISSEIRVMPIFSVFISVTRQFYSLQFAWQPFSFSFATNVSNYCLLNCCFWSLEFDELFTGRWDDRNIVYHLLQMEMAWIVH